MVIILFLVLLGCSDGGTASPTDSSTSSPPPTQASQPPPSAPPVVTPPADPVPPPKPPPLVWALNVPVAGGVLTGTISYDVDVQPYTLNTNNTGPNALYHLRDWHLVVSPTIVDPEPVVFVPEGNTPSGILCLGVGCIFDPRILIRLTMRDVTGRYALQLVLQPPTNALPLVNEDWGLWVGNASWLQLYPTFMLMPLGEIHLVVPDLKS